MEEDDGRVADEDGASDWIIGLGAAVCDSGGAEAEEEGGGG